MQLQGSVSEQGVGVRLQWLRKAAEGGSTSLSGTAFCDRSMSRADGAESLYCVVDCSRALACAVEELAGGVVLRYLTLSCRVSCSPLLHMACAGQSASVDTMAWKALAATGQQPMGVARKHCAMSTLCTWHGGC